jgi:pectate lyase
MKRSACELRFRRGGGVVILVACAAFGNASCTVIADEFSPAPFDESAATSAGNGSTTAPGEAADARDQAPPTSGVAATSAAARPETTPTPRGPVVGGEPSTGSAVDLDAVDSAAADAGSNPVAPVSSAPSLSQLVGWASVAGLGVETTTGGGLTPPIVARTAAELTSLAASPEPLTIAIVGTLDVGRVDLTSNKTLIGIGADATLRGGIAIRGSADAPVENVIVANLNVAAETSLVAGDGILVQFAHHVWIDHCALRDAPDGLLDIVRASDFVTVSNTLFFYTPAAPDLDHRFAALVGHDILNAAEDSGHLNVTWHHNWWAEGVTIALLGRYGGIHVYNNLFRSPGGNNVLAAGVASSWLVEDNHFEAVTAPHTILEGSAASLVAVANVYEGTTGARDATALGFEPPYAYAPDSPLGLAERIMAEAGPQL